MLEAVRAEPPQVVVPFEPRRRRFAPVLGAAAAVAAIVALAVGVWALDLSSQLDDTRSALDRERAAAAIVANPDSRTVNLAAGDRPSRGRPRGKRCTRSRGLGPAPAGKTYELWIVPGGNIDDANRAGIFGGRDGAEIVGVEGTVGAGDRRRRDHRGRRRR